MNRNCNCGCECEQPYKSAINFHSQDDIHLMRSLVEHVIKDIRHVNTDISVPDYIEEAVVSSIEQRFMKRIQYHCVHFDVEIVDKGHNQKHVLCNDCGFTQPVEEPVVEPESDSPVETSQQYQDYADYCAPNVTHTATIILDDNGRITEMAYNGSPPKKYNAKPYNLRLWDTAVVIVCYDNGTYQVSVLSSRTGIPVNTPAHKYLKMQALIDAAEMGVYDHFESMFLTAAPNFEEVA